LKTCGGYRATIGTAITGDGTTRVGIIGGGTAGIIGVGIGGIIGDGTAGIIGVGGGGIAGNGGAYSVIAANVPLNKSAAAG